MKLKEVAVAGLWAASVVEVAGFTWTAFQSTYKTFPDTGSNSSASTGSQASVNANETSTGAPKNAQGVADILSNPLAYPKGTGTGTFGINGPITKFLGGLLGLNSSGIKRSAPPAGKKAPPTALVTAVRKAVTHPTQKGVSQATSNFTRWAYANRWTTKDITTYFKNIGVML